MRAIKEILKRDGRLMLTVIADSSDGRFYLFSKHTNDEEKVDFLNAVKTIFLYFEVDEYKIYSENFYVAGPDCNDEIAKGETKVRSLETKRECVTEIIVNQEKKKMTMIPFERKGNEIVFSDDEKVVFDGAEGAFTNLLLPTETRKKFLNLEGQQDMKAFIKSKVLPNFGRLEPRH